LEGYDEGYGLGLGLAHCGGGVRSSECRPVANAFVERGASGTAAWRSTAGETTTDTVSVRRLKPLRLCRAAESWLALQTAGQRPGLIGCNFRLDEVSISSSKHLIV